MVALKILMLNKFQNHPKRAMGKLIPSISHNYSKLLRSYHKNSAVVVRSRGFCENSGVRGHIGPLYLESLFFPAEIEVAIELLSGIKMFLISMVALKKN